MRTPATHFVILLFIAFHGAFAQVDSVTAINEIKTFQQELNDEYRDPAKSPMEKEDRSSFRGHDFFPIDLRFRVLAKLKVTSSTAFFKMKTTTVRLDDERIYGLLEFLLDGKTFQLPVYQSSRLMKTNEYKRLSFLSVYGFNEWY